MLRITHFVCLAILISIIGSGCSEKEEETDDISTSISNEANTQNANDVSTQDTNDVAVNEESTASETEETSEALITEETSEALITEGNNFPWTLVSESGVATSVFYAGFLNDSIGVTVGYAGEISYTVDGGKNWYKSNNVSACRYGLDYYDESFIISSGNSGVNLVSKDQGKSWSNLGDFPLKSSKAYNKFLSVIDSENIYIGAPKSLGVSKDGGKTWKEIEVPEKCTIIAGMFFLTSEIGYLLNVDGTLFKTIDSCETWTTQTIDLSGEQIDNPNKPSVAINFQDENHGMIVFASKSYKIFCLKTEDGGSTWEIIEMPKPSGQYPYISRDGQFLTLSSVSKKISLYKLQGEAVPTPDPLVLPLITNDSGKVRIQTVASSNTDDRYNSYIITSINGESVVVDPTEMPLTSVVDINPAAILVTHNHSDHTDSVFQGQYDCPQLIYTKGEIDTEDFHIYTILSSHSNDTIDGSNVIVVFEVDGLRIAHMGDIGQTALTEEQLKELGEIDIAFMQFENGYSNMSLVNKKGFTLMEQLSPKIIIPTHYSVNALYAFLENYDTFTDFDNILEISKEELPEKAFTVYRILNSHKYQ